MTKAQSSSDSAVSAEENVSGTATHSLLKKDGPDAMLMSAYKKVEKKLDAALKVNLSAMLDVKVALEVDESQKQSFEDWLSGQETDSVYLQFQLGASESPIMVRVTRSFLTASVDCFFGGQINSDAQPTGELKKSEISMIERLAGAIAAGLTEAWSVLFETRVRYICFFHDKDEIELELEDGNILVSSTSVEISGHQIEAFDIVQTIDGLIAIEPQINRPNLREASEADPIWKTDLKDSVEQVYLPVRSVLARPTMLLSELSNLAVGDILPVSPTDNVPLIVGDMVFAQGSIGEQNGAVAFKINQFV